MEEDKIKLAKSVPWKKPQDEFSCPQKCKLRKELIGNLNISPGTLILVNQKIVCKFFYLEDNYSYSQCFLDDSVTIRPSNSDVNELQELEVIKENVEFEVMEVNLVIESDFKFVKSREGFADIARTLLKNYVFSENCEISYENKLGIRKIIANKTIPDGFGSSKLDGSSQIIVNDIVLEEHSNRIVRELGALADAYKELQTMIQLNQNYKENPTNFQTRPACQALLIGPSGTGKSSIVRHLAHKNSCNIIEIQPDVFKPYPGETEAELEKIFQNAKVFSKLSNKLLIILFENIEIFCPKFDPKIKEFSHGMRICSQIGALLDDISRTSQGIVVLATTSKIETLSVTVRHVNRLEHEILFEMPDQNGRMEILGILLRDLIQGTEIPAISTFIADRTPGFVGADLEVLCQTAIRKTLAGKLEIDRLDYKKLENIFEDSLKLVFPSVLRESMGMVTRSTMKLEAIAGMEELKTTLRTSVLGPLRNPEIFRRFGLQPPKGILFYGPSGCAKTTIAKCLAGETQMTLISVSSAEIYSPYVGEAEKFIIRLFNKARMSAPAILFFDEIDAIVGNRTMAGGGGASDVNTRILSTLLTEIDGFGASFGGKSEKTVLVIGATNRPDCIDDALMRPGRFDKLVYIPAPDYASRLNILEFIARKMPIHEEVDFKELAQRTQNFSGADLFNLCNEVSLKMFCKFLYFN
jgi:SpoVK/Ycf46/Vps4 family AAA+-type ATPase